MILVDNPVDETPIVTFRETPKQRQFAEAVFSDHEPAYRYLLFGGAIRGGKSICEMAIVFALCRVFPGSRWAIVRKDLPTLKRNTLPTFNKLRSSTNGFVEQMNRTDWISECANGSQILFFAESLQDDPTWERWRGLEVNGFAFEEIQECDVGSFYKAIERAGSWVIPNLPVQPPPYILATCNPSAGWVKRTFYDPWKAGTLAAPYFYLPSNIHDNPYLPAAYLDSLKHLPERDYNVYVNGDWDALTGAALEELNAKIHLIKPFQVPDHFTRFGAFDWGFAHPFSDGSYAAAPEGDLLKIDTITGRRLADAQMIEYILQASAPTAGTPWLVSAKDRAFTVAGQDAFHDVKAREAIGMTTAERFARAGIPMIPADPSRVSGLKNLRDFLAWQRTGKGGTPGTPRLRFFDTPGNRRCFEQLQEMVLDPDKPEDVKKVDADANGMGGDDCYDETRYSVQHRAVGVQPPVVETERDRHPGFDYKGATLKPRRASLSQMVNGEEDDDIRPGRYRMPRAASFRMPGMGVPDDEDDGEGGLLD